MPGYTVGPVLEPGESPWPVCWEQSTSIDDGHRHVWESVLLPAHAGRSMQECVRCVECQAPRCGDSTEDDPCMRRRHHKACHELLSGALDHIGGQSTGCCRPPGQETGT